MAVSQLGSQKLATSNSLVLQMMKSGLEKGKLTYTNLVLWPESGNFMLLLCSFLKTGLFLRKTECE